MQKYYLAYGSNLNLKQMVNRCKDAKLVGTTILKNFRLAYKGDCDGYSYLTIEPKEGSFVPLGIYIINVLDEYKLNKYEGYPFLYHKKYINIIVDNKIKKALIYIMNDEFDYHIPSQSYIDICKEGYRDFEFDENILDDAYIYTLENLSKKKIR